MTINTLLTTLVCILSFAMPEIANARTFGVATSPFVDHPVQHPIQGRSSSVWRSRVGTWGENLAEEFLRLRGFNEIHEIKNGSNNGIDRIAIKRRPNGEILDSKFVEVKTSRSTRPKLGMTNYGGTQMSQNWLANNFSKMRSSGNPALKKLALELSHFRKVSGKSIESFGEIIHVNTSTGRITGYSADGRAVRYSQSIERTLRNVEAKAGRQEARSWATRTLSQWDQVRAVRMSNWLGVSVPQQSNKLLLSNAGSGISATRTEVLRQSRSTAARKLLLRSAGRIALVVALAMDAKELFDTEYAFRTGAISVRQRNIQHISTIGGIGGAFAGASAGGLTGVWVGSFGGPFAWITVPTGGFIGAVVGGVGGYFAGSEVARYGATAWYNSIDASVREKFEVGWINTPGFHHE
jgi:hypothetical protein